VPRVTEKRFRFLVGRPLNGKARRQPFFSGFSGKALDVTTFAAPRISADIPTAPTGGLVRRLVGRRDTAAGRRTIDRLIAGLNRGAHSHPVA
jgi:hypothetical protein